MHHLRIYIWESLVHEVSSKFPEVNPMSRVTQRIQWKTVGRSSSLCVLDPTSSSGISGGPARPGSPSKTAFFCPLSLGSAASDIYAKSTSINCGVSLQAKFLLSPLTTAVNYKTGRGVFELEWQWEEAKKRSPETFFVHHKLKTTHTATLGFSRWTSQTTVNLFFIGLCGWDLL